MAIEAWTQVRLLSGDERADILEQAADLYESERIEWCKGKFFNGRHRPDFEPIVSACALGAIRLTLVNMDRDAAWRFKGNDLLLNHESQIHMDLIHALRRIYGEFSPIDVPSWNDHLRRTKQEVIDLFKEVAKDLRNTEEEGRPDDVFS